MLSQNNLKFKSKLNSCKKMKIKQRIANIYVFKPKSNRKSKKLMASCTVQGKFPMCCPSPTNRKKGLLL